MRYVGQGHEITVELPQRRPDRRSDAQALREAYERDYAALFERHIPDAAIEILSWSVLGLDRGASCRRVAGCRARPRRPKPVGSRRCSTAAAAAPPRCRSIAASSCRRAAPSRARRSSPRTRPRPIISASFAAHIDASGCIVMDRKDGEEHSMSQSNSVGLIDLQIMWNRLIAVVEEQAQALMRTAFSADRARVRRPLGRRVRPRRAACWRRPSPARRATSIRWPRSVKHFIAPLPGRDHEAGRRLHHQRSVDGHRPSQRLRHHHAVLQERQAGRRCSPAPAI